MHGLPEARRLSDHDLDHVAGGGWCFFPVLGPNGMYYCPPGPSQPFSNPPGGASPSQPLPVSGPHFRLP